MGSSLGSHVVPFLSPSSNRAAPVRLRAKPKAWPVFGTQCFFPHSLHFPFPIDTPLPSSSAPYSISKRQKPRLREGNGNEWAVFPAKPRSNVIFVAPEDGHPRSNVLFVAQESQSPKRPCHCSFAHKNSTPPHPAQEFAAAASPRKGLAAALPRTLPHRPRVVDPLCSRALHPGAPRELFPMEFPSLSSQGQMPLPMPTTSLSLRFPNAPGHGIEQRDTLGHIMELRCSDRHHLDAIQRESIALPRIVNPLMLRGVCLATIVFQSKTRLAPITVGNHAIKPRGTMRRTGKSDRRVETTPSNPHAPTMHRGECRYGQFRFHGRSRLGENLPRGSARRLCAPGFLHLRTEGNEPCGRSQRPTHVPRAIRAIERVAATELVPQRKQFAERKFRRHLDKHNLGRANEDVGFHSDEGVARVAEPRTVANNLLRIPRSLTPPNQKVNREAAAFRT